MKKLILLTILVLLTVGFISCGDSGSDEDSTTGSITVNVTYTGVATPAKVSTDPGSLKVYVYLYKTLTLNADETVSVPDKQISTDAAVTNGTEETLTINNIEPGDYYMVIIHDTILQSSKVAGNNDYYVIYNEADTTNYTTNFTSEATPITVTAGSDENFTISFGTDYALNGSGAYDLPVAK